MAKIKAEHETAKNVVVVTSHISKIHQILVEMTSFAINKAFISLFLLVQMTSADG
jgi:hypothetical protein